MARPTAFVETNFAGVAVGNPVAIKGKANANLNFAGGVGTVRLERSYDNGVNWRVTTKPDLTAASFTADTDFVFEEPEDQILYRWNCTAFTSGPIGARISQ